MKSITVQGSFQNLKKVQNIYKAKVGNISDDAFTTIYEGTNEKGKLSGCINSNYQEAGEKYLHQFRQSCLEIFPEDSLIEE